MKFFFSLLLACALCGNAVAGEKKPSAQNQKMKSCNAEAKAQGLKGDARKAFMSGCLKKKPAG